MSALFVIPYPPGFPILVPGQVISEEILAFIEALDTREIHGYRPELGFRVFTDEALVEPRSSAAERGTGPGRCIAGRIAPLSRQRDTDRHLIAVKPDGHKRH